MEVVANWHEQWHKSLESEEKTFQRSNINVDEDLAMTSPVISASFASEMPPSISSVPLSLHSHPNRKSSRTTALIPNPQPQPADQTRTQVKREESIQSAADRAKAALVFSPPRSKDLPPLPFSESQLNLQSPSVNGIKGEYRPSRSQSHGSTSTSETSTNFDQRYPTENSSTRRESWSSKPHHPQIQQGQALAQLSPRTISPSTSHIAGRVIGSSAEQSRGSDVDPYRQPHHIWT